MSNDRDLNRYTLLIRILCGVGIVVGAGVLGLLLGHWTAPNLLPAGLPAEEGDGEAPEPVAEAAPEKAEQPLEEPPLLLQLGVTPDSQWDILTAQATYASKIGIDRLLIPVPLPWGEGEGAEVAVETLKRFQTVNPAFKFMVQVDLNPPAAWFDSHGAARMAGTVGEVPLPTPASSAWLEASLGALDRLRRAFGEAGLEPSIAGYALYGLVNGAWQRGAGADTSEENLAGFRAWLHRTYPDDAALQKAWKNPEALRAEAGLPGGTAQEGTPSLFYALETDMSVVDYHRYAAESVADAIAAVAAHLRMTAGPAAKIWVNYGHTFEKARSNDGHLALGTLLDSDVNAFMAPVSMLNRGIGATGGFMGPVDSAKAHGKEWVIVDDTRTGIAWNQETGQVEQIRGLRAEDVHDVQRRNFALAALHGLTVVWSDPGGEGFFHDDTQWEVFGQLRDIYQRNIMAGLAPAGEEAPAAGEEEIPPVENSESVDAPPVVPSEAVHPTVLALIDEESQFLLRDGGGVDALLAANRDAVLASGASASFHLLDDLLDSQVAPAPVYLFLNAYRLTTSEARALHERFAAEKAIAIWIYAPGYLDVTMNRANVADTVGMEVKLAEDPSVAGSTYTLNGGHWIDAGQAIGETRPLKPLFYVDDPEADTLATYTEGGKASVAVRTMEAGWTSVFVGEPVLSPALLRELLRILEQPIYFRPGKERFFDTSIVDGTHIAVHAAESGERILNLGQFYDIQDLFEPDMGWQQRESIVLEMRKGETRLLRLTPR